jgi:prevent-host-death family protein
MKVISVSEGRKQFSTVVATAAKGEPQIITKNGRQVAVILSYQEYYRLKNRERSFSEFPRPRLLDPNRIEA